MAFDKNIAASVAESFGAKKQAREELILKRRSELYIKIPELKALEDEIAKVSFKTFLKVADGFDPDKAAVSIKEEVDSLTAKRDALIKGAGYDKDYLNPPYDCPLCKDEGFLDNSYCHCFRKELIKRTFAESNLANLSDSTFDNFSLKYYNGEDKYVAEQNLNACRRYAEKFTKSSPSLLFMGGTGLGKTHLSTSIAKAVIDKG